MPFDEKNLERFQKSLDENMTWPCRYLFKFIVPQIRLASLMVLFDGSAYHLRDSANGNYVGLTAEVEVASSDQVADIYRRAARIEGIVIL